MKARDELPRPRTRGLTTDPVARSVSLLNAPAGCSLPASARRWVTANRRLLPLPTSWSAATQTMASRKQSPSTSASRPANQIASMPMVPWPAAPPGAQPPLPSNSSLSTCAPTRSGAGSCSKNSECHVRACRSPVAAMSAARAYPPLASEFLLSACSCHAHVSLLRLPPSLLSPPSPPHLLADAPWCSHCLGTDRPPPHSPRVARRRLYHSSQLA